MVQKKLTNRQMKAIETKEALYQAAIKLFNEEGYENVLVEDITNLAGTAKGTFYNYFHSKKGALYHTFTKFDQIYQEAYDLVKNTTTFEQRLLGFIKHAYKEINNMGKKIPWALYYNSMLDDSPLVLSNDRVLYQIVNEIVDFGLKIGDLDTNKPSSHYVELIKTQLLGIDYRWCVSSEQIDFSEFALSNMSVFIHGIIHR